MTAPSSLMKRIRGTGTAVLAAGFLASLTGCAVKNGAVMGGYIANDLTCPEATHHADLAQEELIKAKASVTDPKLGALARLGQKKPDETPDFVKATESKSSIAAQVREDVCRKSSSPAQTRVATIGFPGS